MGKYFDEALDDEPRGRDSYEKTESAMVRRAARLALGKAGLSEQDMAMMLGGDLLNQIIGANFAARELKIPFLGMYGACSTMAETLILASLVLSGGYGRYALCTTSSHFSTAERQYRFPLEHGNQRPPTAQWTVTGAAATILSTDPAAGGPVIEAVTVGAICDKDIKDANNMGAAMAPAAADTITNHFLLSGMSLSDYDLIVTGDLGRVGLGRSWIYWSQRAGDSRKGIRLRVRDLRK
jgi:stage V sporulation protein AD